SDARTQISDRRSARGSGRRAVSRPSGHARIRLRARRDRGDPRLSEIGPGALRGRMSRVESRLDLGHGAAGRLARRSRLVGRDREQAMSFAAMMVHLDVERDCEQRVQLALDLANRFQAALIGIAGLALRPAFAAGGIVVYSEPTEQDRRALMARFDEMGNK